MKTISWIALLAAVGCLICSVGATEINGQVFIVTKGGNSIKLGLVTVSIYDRPIIDEFLKKKKADALPVIEYFTPWHNAALSALKKAKEAKEKISAEWMRNSSDKNLDNQYDKSREAVYKAEELERKIKGYIDYTSSGFYYFENLPKEIKSAKTDADGKFSISAPPGNYVIAASSTRHAGGDLESYYWMVEFNAGEATSNIMLSNDNLSYTGSKESIIRTNDEEMSALDGVNAGGIEGLTKIVETQKQKQQKAAEELRAQADLDKKSAQERQEKVEIEAYRINPALAQKKAVELYPALGTQGSPLNAEFIARAKRYRSEKPDFLTEPDWPIRLAKEISEESK